MVSQVGRAVGWLGARIGRTVLPSIYSTLIAILCLVNTGYPVEALHAVPAISIRVRVR